MLGSLTGQLRRAATGSSTCLRRYDAGFRPLADDGALEFCNAPQGRRMKWAGEI
jgi:hypothetical protein